LELIEILKQKQQQNFNERTKQSDEDYKSMFESLEEGIILFLNSEIKFVNKVFIRLLHGLDIIQN
jgi:PAS domain-containing protein